MSLYIFAYNACIHLCISRFEKLFAPPPLGVTYFFVL